MDIFETKSYRLSRKLIVAEAAFEYLISILVTDAFLARLTTSLGFSDSLTGVLSAIASLGCIFQLASVLIRTRHIKKLVLCFTFVSELLFLLLYMVPMTGFSPKTKSMLFVLFLTLAYLSAMMVAAKKKNWFMSLVDDRKRGRFTAVTEFFSLAAGIAFSFVMGRVIDSSQDGGNLNRGFMICAAVVLLLLVLQMLSQVFSAEGPEPEDPAEVSIREGIRSVVTDRTILSLTVFLVLYRVGVVTATSFYGTYQIRELGFSQTLVVALTAAGRVVRMAFTPVMGRYADRCSFAKMERICLFFLMAGFIMAGAATPANGRFFFALYYVTNGIAMAGANSAMTNLIFDYVPTEKRSDALAVSQAVSGTAGFAAALAAGSLVNRIQENGNCFLGMNVYAQQLTSLIAAVIMGICIVYINRKFIRKP